MTLSTLLQHVNIFRLETGGFEDRTSKQKQNPTLKESQSSMHQDNSRARKPFTPIS
jgi:hypothetical protein